MQDAETDQEALQRVQQNAVKTADAEKQVRATRQISSTLNGRPLSHTATRTLTSQRTILSAAPPAHHVSRSSLIWCSGGSKCHAPEQRAAGDDVSFASEQGTPPFYSTGVVHVLGEPPHARSALNIPHSFRQQSGQETSTRILELEDEIERVKGAGRDSVMDLTSQRTLAAPRMALSWCPLVATAALYSLSLFLNSRSESRRTCGASGPI